MYPIIRFGWMIVEVLNPIAPLDPIIGLLANDDTLAGLKVG